MRDACPSAWTTRWIKRVESRRSGEFQIEAAKLVASHGGSLSGEHDDGRAPSDLLPLMYGNEAVQLFGRIKHAFDPTGLLNPEVLVDPDPSDASIRPARVPPDRVRGPRRSRLVNPSGSSRNTSSAESRA